MNYLVASTFGFQFRHKSFFPGWGPQVGHVEASTWAMFDGGVPPSKPLTSRPHVSVTQFFRVVTQPSLPHDRLKCGAHGSVEPPPPQRVHGTVHRGSVYKVGNRIYSLAVSPTATATALRSPEQPPCRAPSSTAPRASATASRTPSTPTATSSSPSSPSERPPPASNRSPSRAARHRFYLLADEFFSGWVACVRAWRQVREPGEGDPAAAPHPRRARRGPELRRPRPRRGPLPRRPPLRPGAPCAGKHSKRWGGGGGGGFFFLVGLILSNLVPFRVVFRRRRSCCRRSWRSRCGRGQGCGSTSA